MGGIPAEGNAHTHVAQEMNDSIDALRREPGSKLRTRQLNLKSRATSSRNLGTSGATCSSSPKIHTKLVFLREDGELCTSCSAISFRNRKLLYFRQVALSAGQFKGRGQAGINEKQAEFFAKTIVISYNC
jgi:hypothetical protein